MKMKTVLTTLLGLGVAGGLCRADDLFKMTWRGTVYYIGNNGQVVAKSFSEKNFVSQIAIDNGLDPKSLVFVYRPDKHDTAVVRASDGAFVSDVIQMEYDYTDVGNTNGSKVVRQAFLFTEASSDAMGSAFGTETMKHDGDGNLTGDSFHGTFNYTMTNAVFSGSFSTGGRVKDTSGS
jgi:hypothetical protein